MVARLSVLVTAGVWAVLCVAISPAWASTVGPLGLPAPPPVSAPVLDQVHALSAATVRQLDRQLGAANASSDGQIAVAVVDSTDGLPIATYAQMLFNYWGVGHSGTNDGVLIVLNMAGHHVRIQTGAGLQTRLPNSEAQTIVDTDMVPSLRAGHPDQAVTLGVAAVETSLGVHPGSGHGGHGTATWLYVLGWIVIGGGIVAWLAWMTFRVRPQDLARPGHTPPHYWGGGGWGGGGGGGGGFGGGTSSGGGATGSW